jgi:hypothetical protein
MEATPAPASYDAGMTEYTIVFICDGGVDRGVEGWDDGLVNYGYSECPHINPVRRKAGERNDARLAERWRTWRKQPHDPKPEGYTIVSLADQFRHMRVRA